MYELIQVSENNYYIQSPAKIGLIKLNDAEVILQIKKHWTNIKSDLFMMLVHILPPWKKSKR